MCMAHRDSTPVGIVPGPSAGRPQQHPDGQGDDHSSRHQLHNQHEFGEKRISDVQRIRLARS